MVECRMTTVQPNVHVRVTRPYADLSGMFPIWATKCRDILVVEHEPHKHETDKRTHCHILLVEPTVQNEQFQKPLRKLNLTGNSDFFFSTKVTKGKYKGQLVDRARTAIYMIKGKYDVNYSQGFTADELVNFKNQWVDSKPDVTNLPSITKKTSRDDVEWNHFLTTYESLKEKKSMIGIKQWIKSDCLRRRKPVPRSSDLNRWAYSIYAITNNMVSPQDMHDLDAYAEGQFIKVD